MRPFISLTLSLFFCIAGARAQAARFIIDDDEYLDVVVAASSNLLHQGKLVAQEKLQRQVRAKIERVELPLPARDKLSPPELCERLRESTLSVGSFYKCPDCDGWHFNASTGFVVARPGVISTCCHVVMGEDDGVKESYLVAADAAGHVFPVLAVLAADPEADTCLLKIQAPDLAPLPLRTGIRTGEPVYCLSNPGGYHFMFTSGLVARLARMRNDALDERGQTNGLLTRPILFLNVTAEFAPGSSGAPIVDESGNVVGQVASISDAGESTTGDEHAAPSPSVPVRFCLATEEILPLTRAGSRNTNAANGAPNRPALQHPKTR